MKTFQIVRGVTTNRVREANAKIVDASPQRARHRYYTADERTRGKVYTTICIAIPVEDLIAIDAEAGRLGVSRSQYLRDAARARVVVK